ncbi:hypothetical protein A500_03616 [Clostridium sartagoforme AAU1]|uniref:DUF4179 domain-containing protein n=1 Tax=Clostridium sartagoforme AAU1 TaxID=1202534 RepID=R9CE74_9CLOT|nr:DUF4179 domain-containing protein [Clostridium sartagoforme]EOR27654.1 hypothetical protein A500_03616 [Clostridium sartagoforme AAU1]
MSKNIYDILNDYNINFDELKEEGFNDIEKKKIKCNIKKSINKNSEKSSMRKKIIIAATLVGIISIGLIRTDVGATVVDNIKKASYDIATFLGIKKDLSPYKTVVNKTLSNYELEIQLNEVILDNDELIISSTFKPKDTKLEGKSISLLPEIIVNGDPLGVTRVGGLGEVVDESGYSAAIECSFKEEEFNGDLDIKIIYRDMFIDQEFKRTEPITFEFTTSSEELSKNTKKIELNNRFILENGAELKLNKYTSNAISKKIYYSIDRKNNEEVPYYIELKGKDNEGNEMIFRLNNGTSGGGVLKLDNKESKISETATSITLTPYLIQFPVESNKSNNDIEEINDNNLLQIGEEFSIQIN